METEKNGDENQGGSAGDHLSAVSKALPPEVQRWQHQAAATFWGLLGCEIKSLSDRQAVITLEIKPHHLNLIGIVHGGVHATMIDSAMGLAAMVARPLDSVVTAGLNLHYVASTGQGTITVTAEILHMSRKTLTVQAEARADNGDMLAIGTGSFRVIGQRTEP